MRWNRSLTKNAKNETERDDHSSTQNGTERDGTERERNENGTIEKKEWERNVPSPTSYFSVFINILFYP